MKKGEMGHPIYNYVIFLTVGEASSMMENSSLEMDLIASSIHFPPGATIDYDTVRLGDSNGGFVYIRGMKVLRLGVVRR
jgi:hypothetical protein